VEKREKMEPGSRGRVTRKKSKESDWTKRETVGKKKMGGKKSQRDHVTGNSKRRIQKPGATEENYPVLQT